MLCCLLPILSSNKTSVIKRLEMIDLEKFVDRLYDRLTQADQPSGHGELAGSLLTTKQIASLIDPMLPDETWSMSRIPRPPFGNATRCQGDSSVTHSSIPLKHALGWTVDTLLGVTGFVPQFIQIHTEAALYIVAWATCLLLRDAVELRSYFPASLLSDGDALPCTAATAVYWWISLFESLRTVCTTVTLLTKDTFAALFAVHTTADLHDGTARRISSTRSVSATPVVEIPGPNLPPITTPPDHDRSDHTQALRGPPPLPPITTPPDEDSNIEEEEISSGDYSSGFNFHGTNYWVCHRPLFKCHSSHGTLEPCKSVFQMTKRLSLLSGALF